MLIQYAQHRSFEESLVLVLLSWFWLTSPCLAQTSSGIAIYSVRNNAIDTSMASKMPPKFKEIMNQLTEDKIPNRLFVSFDGRYSKSESMDDIASLTPFQQSMATIMTQGTYCYDRSKDLLTKATEQDGIDYLVIQSKKGVKWIDTGESEIISGYPCNKLVYIDSARYSSAKQEFIKSIIWYTDEVSIPIGPKQYVGLPGLVVRIEDNMVVYQLEELAYESSDIPINCHDEGTLITQDEYDQLWKERPKKE